MRKLFLVLAMLVATSAQAQTSVGDLVGLGMPSELAEQVDKLNSATGALAPAADDTYDVGSASAEYQDAYFDGVLYADEVGDSLTPETDDAIDLGTASAQWQDAYFDGLVTTDEIEVQGYFASADATNHGLIVQSSANQACDTTCSSSGCIIGFDSGSSVFVACSGSTADTCVCAAAPRL